MTLVLAFSLGLGLPWFFPGADRVALAQDRESCPDNLVVNGGFEAGFSARGQVGRMVANGWRPWFETLPGVDGINYVPDYRPLRRTTGLPPLVVEGLWSQEQATQAASHTAGLFQVVAVPEAATLRAAVLAYAWASAGEDPTRSAPYGTYALQLGIDPLGGRDPKGASLYWTAPITVTDAWLPLVLEAPAAGPVATLFLRGQALVRLAHNVARWDAACLQALGPAETDPDTTPVAAAAPAPVPTGDAPPPTPDAPMAQAIIARQLAARGATPLPPEATPGARATLAALSTRIAAGGSAGAGAAPGGALWPPVAGQDGAGDLDLGARGDEAGGATLTARLGESLGAWADGNLGLVVLALAAFLGAFLLAAGRSRGPAA